MRPLALLTCLRLLDGQRRSLGHKPMSTRCSRWSKRLQALRCRWIRLRIVIRRARIMPDVVCALRAKDLATGAITSTGVRVECSGPHAGERPILLARNEIKRFYPAGKRG